MKCEDRFVTTRSRNQKLVDCNVHAGATWREGKYQLRLLVSHSWEQGKGSQDLQITMTPSEAIELGKELLIQAARRLAEKAKEQSQ